jgi:hypothetical protein
MRTGRDNALIDRRYQARRDMAHRGLWQVTDTLTGLPAASDGKDFVNLSRSDARDIADALETYLNEGKEPPLV